MTPSQRAMWPPKHQMQPITVSVAATDNLAPAPSCSIASVSSNELSAVYGELDGENNHAYATTFAEVNASLSAEQRARLVALRRSSLSGTYLDGTRFDYSVATAPYLYAEVITDTRLLTPYIGNTDGMFFDPIGQSLTVR